jgi:hypothetical protein
LREVHSDRGLSHTRASRDDDEISPLESSELEVESFISGRDTIGLGKGRICMDRSEFFISGVEDIFDMHELILDESLGDRKE